MKNDPFLSKLSGLYLAGFLLILALPLLAISPWFFPPEWGKAIVFRLIISFLGIIFAWHLFSKHQIVQQLMQSYARQKRVFQMILVMGCILVVSTLFSIDISTSLWGNPHRAGGAVIFAGYFIFSILLSIVVTAKDWRTLFNVSFVVADIAVLFGMLQYFDVLPNVFIDYTSRPPSTLSSPDYFGLYLLLLFFINIAFLLQASLKNKVFYGINALLLTFGIFVSGSRSAYLGVLLGGLFFVLLYPKKIKWVKIATGALIFIMTVVIAYVTIFPTIPNAIKGNPRLSYFYERLSLKYAFDDLTGFRFSGWRIFGRAVMEKPLLGWGAENISSGFDKHYDPTIPNIDNTWWDRAHNIFLDLAASYGIPFTILYLFFFGFIFFKLHAIRKKNPLNTLSIHALQATLIGYFIALLFGFDSVSTYLTLFFLVGYCLYLIGESSAILAPEEASRQVTLPRHWITLQKIKKPAIAVVALLWVVFAWSYHFKPLSINAQINIIESIEAKTTAENCKQKLDAFEKLLDKKSFLDVYSRLKYVELTQDCLSRSYEPQRMPRVLDELRLSAQLKPNYTRTWLLLGAFTTVLAANEQDPHKKAAFILEAQEYLKKADILSPGRQQTAKEWAKTYFVAEDFMKMQGVAKNCVERGGDTSLCDWYLGLAETLLGNTAEGQKYIELAKEHGYPYALQSSYGELAAVYTKTNNYTQLVPVYKKLLEFEPFNAQFHATLAFVYKELKMYSQARAQALYILEFEPEAKEDVEAFLRTLPQ